jgi:hypothetical protein
MSVHPEDDPSSPVSSGGLLRIALASPTASRAPPEGGSNDGLSAPGPGPLPCCVSEPDSPQGGSPAATSNDMDPSRVCALCFDRVPEIVIGGCEHRMCSHCAGIMLGRVTDKPLTCP